MSRDRILAHSKVPNDTPPHVYVSRCCLTGSKVWVSMQRLVMMITDLVCMQAFYQHLLAQVNSYDWKTHYHELAIAFECAHMPCISAHATLSIVASQPAVQLSRSERTSSWQHAKKRENACCANQT